MIAVNASPQSSPSAETSTSAPVLAASIIKPMMERALTDCPSRLTTISDLKRAAASTIFAAWLGSFPGDAREIGGAGAHIFPPGIDRFLDRLVERELGAHIDQFDEAGKIDAGKHFDLAALQNCQSEIARRAAEHVN